ncbi:MAG: GerMN domain-containing protein [Angustibacter sp.]
MRSIARTTSAAVVLSALISCGLPDGGPPRRIDPTDVPYELTNPSATSTPPGATGNGGGTEPGDAQLTWVNSDGLLAREAVTLSATGQAAQLTELLTLLSAGPAPQQRDLGLSSALGPGTELRVVEIDRRVAVLDLRIDSNPPANRLPVLVGQIVLTATTTPGIDLVRFVSDDRPRQVPLVGGELTTRELERTDYIRLLAPPNS